MSDEGCTCQRCGNKFTMDLNVPPELWERIKPVHKPKGAGLLCGTCIVQLIEALDEFSSWDLLPTK